MTVVVVLPVGSPSTAVIVFLSVPILGVGTADAAVVEFALTLAVVFGGGGCW